MRISDWSSDGCSSDLHTKPALLCRTKVVMPQITPRPASILIVEDEMLIALSTSATLSDLGYEVIGIAATAEDALRSAARRQPVLLLMDLTLREQGDGQTGRPSVRERGGKDVEE